MRTQRQPSEQFLRRLNAYREPSPVVAVPIEPQTQAVSMLVPYKRWGSYAFRFLEVLALLFIFPTVYMLIVDLEDRQTQRIAQAWQLITQNAPGNSGKVQALEYLNSADCDPPNDPTKWELLKSCGFTALFVSPKQRGQLNGVDLSENTHSSSVYLSGIELSGAFLSTADLSGAFLIKVDLSEATLNFTDLLGTNFDEANLSGASLVSANLSGANLVSANLSGANLASADLSGANLSFTDLSGAFLAGADLSGAFLAGADLSGAFLAGADLSGAVLAGADLSGANLNFTDLSGAFLASALNLILQKLNTSCGNEETQLPKGLTIKSCFKNLDNVSVPIE